LVEHLAGATGDRAGAVAALEEVSGIGEIEAARGRLSARRDVLKATHALTSLERLSWASTTSAADAGRIRRWIAEMRADPALSVIEQLDALDMIAAEPELVSDDERVELAALFGGPAGRIDIDPYQAAARWHAVAGSPRNKTRRRHIASIARSAYQALHHEHTTRP